MDAFALSEKDDRIAELEGDVRTLQTQKERAEADAQRTKEKLRVMEVKKDRYKADANAIRQFALDAEAAKEACIAGFEKQLYAAAAEIDCLTSKAEKAEEEMARVAEQAIAEAKAAQQSVIDAGAAKEACIASYEKQLRVTADDKANLIYRVKSAEEKASIAEQAIVEAQVCIGKLEELAKAGEENEEVLQSQIAVLDLALQRSDARVEGLKADNARSDVEIEMLRADAVSKEEAVGQLSDDHAQLRAGVDGMVASYEALVTAQQAKLLEWEQGYDKIVYENDAMRVYIEGIQAVGLTETSPGTPSSTLASLAESSEDSDTPSLTFCDSDAVFDDSPIQDQDRSLPTPADTHQRVVHCTLTTSTSAELVSCDNGTAILVTSSSALSVTYDEPSPRTFAAHFVPTRHSTPKRTRPSRRPRIVHRGFLQKVEFRRMELPLCPAVPIQTSAARPCDVPDMFSPSYRGIDTHQPTRASVRFVRFLRACPDLRDAYEPIIPYPAGHSAARSRILYNRAMKFAQTPTTRR